MSINLLVEVREHAPADLSLGERLALVWIAEQSRDEDRVLDNGNFVAARTCFPGNEDLARWCGVSVDGLRKIFARLAARNLDVRVQQGTDKNGRPVYAAKGFRMVLRLPDLGGTPVPPSDVPDENRTKGGTPIPGQGGRASQVRGDERPTSGGTSVPPTQDLSLDLSRDVPPLSVASATATTNTAVAILDDEPPSTVQSEVITEEETLDFIASEIGGYQGNERALAERWVADGESEGRVIFTIQRRRMAGR